MFNNLIQLIQFKPKNLMFLILDKKLILKGNSLLYNI